MTDHSDLIDRLRAACVGYPRASIAWPHRLLHEAADALSSQSLSLSEAREALSECEEYFDNRADADCDQDGFIPNKEMRLLSVVRTALQALENGPAGLADATNDPPSPDLSSLRKGAEVAVKPLEWEETFYQSHDTPPELTGWEAEGACGYYHIKIEYTGFEASLDGVSFFKIGTFDDPDEAKSAAQSDFETRIRSALIGGGQ